MFFESTTINVTIMCALIVALTFDYITKFFSYWYVRLVPYKHPIPLFGSDFERVANMESATDIVKKLYKRYDDEKYIGYIKCRKPELIVKDPETIKSILTKDFYYFSNRGHCLNNTSDNNLNNSLYFSEDEKWFGLRERMETGIKHYSNEHKNNIARAIEMESTQTNAQEVNAFEIALRFACNTFLNGENDAMDIVKRINTVTFGRKLKNYIMTVFPSLFSAFGLRYTSNQVQDAIRRMCINEIKDSNNYISMVMNLRGLGTIDVPRFRHSYKKLNSFTMPFDESVINAQVFSLLKDGIIPIANTCSIAMFELAKRIEVQEEIFKEIEKLDKDFVGGLNSCKLLKSFICETLRLYPFCSLIQRICTTAYKIPNTDIVIDKGVTVIIPVEEIHKDVKYYINPNVFEPYRFISEDMMKHPFTYLPYGAGPRSCIGEKLSRDVITCCLATLIKMYKITRCDKTTTDPLTMFDDNFTRAPREQILLNFQLRN